MRLALIAVVAVASFAMPASARPDTDCATDVATAVATYDPASVTDYPGFVVGQAIGLAGCVS